MFWFTNGSLMNPRRMKPPWSLPDDGNLTRTQGTTVLAGVR